MPGQKLKVQNALFDFLRASLIPVLCSDVTACSARNIHCSLIVIFAVGAFPHKFSVFVCYNLNLAGVAALLAIVAFCIEFGIHDVIVNVL